MYTSEITPRATIEGMKDEKEDQIKFRIRADLKQRFQIWCIENGQRMSDVLREAVETVVSSAPKQQSDEKISQFFQTLESGEQPTNIEIVKTARLLQIRTDTLINICDCFKRQKEKDGSKY